MQISEEHADATARLLASTELKHVSITLWGDGRYMADTYYPNDGEISQHRHVCGHGDTIQEAFADLSKKLDAVKNERPKLQTAAECKAAALKAIDEQGLASSATELRAVIEELPV